MRIDGGLQDCVSEKRREFAEYNLSKYYFVGRCSVRFQFLVGPS